MREILPKSFSGRLVFWVFITCFFCLVVVSSLHLAYTFESAKSASTAKLNSHVVNLTADFQSRIDSLGRDVRYLASTPPIKGIMRAKKGGGIDPIDQSSLDQWKQRLKILFKEMLIVHPEYLQVRYIGVANDGKEIVRVDWKDRRLVAAPEQLLQAKGSEPYFLKAVQSPLDKVALSEFSLNREWGKIVKPPQLVLRASVPVADEFNQVFGFVIINMLAERALEALLERHKTGEVSGIYSSSLKPLVSSSLSSGWVVESSSEQDSEIQAIFGRASRENPVVESEFSDRLVVARKIYYDSLDPEKFLGVTLSSSKEEAYSEAWRAFYKQVFVVALLVVFAMLLLLISIRRQTRPLQQLRLLANDLAKGVKIPRKPGLEKKSDELSSLMLAFYDMADEIQQKTAILNLQKQALDETALVSETDARGRITYANKKFAELTGYSVEELLGSDHRIVNSGHHPKEFFADLWKTIAQGHAWRGEVKNRKKDGSYYWVDSSIVPFKDLAGKIQKYISIRFDITEKKQQEQKLKELTEAKSKFLAIMSHEIRTPLGAVLGLAELLAATKLNADQQEYVDNIGHSADMLLNILNDILDFSKLDSGKVVFNREPCDVREIGTSAVNIFKEKSVEKKIVLNLKIDAGLPLFLELDALRIKQVLINLISNSIKFTDQGRIDVGLAYHADTARLAIEVSDTGIGMTESQLERVFKEFEQAEDDTTKKYGGTGLGLPICQKIVWAMGGDLKVSSKKGIGTTFTLEIPTQVISTSRPLPSRSETSLPSQIDSNLKILFADDNELNQTIFVKMLADQGLVVKTVENGLQAVLEAEANDFDLICLDIQMPKMDGTEACQRIKALEKYRDSTVWILALTANTFEEDVKKYEAVGFDDYLAKPFTRKSLYKAFGNYTSKKGYFSTLEKDNVITTNELDVEVIDDVLDSGIDLSGPYLLQFEASVEKKLSQIQDGLNQKDTEKVKNAAHTLKGLCLGFGMASVGQQLQELEELSNKQDWKSCETLFSKIPECIEHSKKSVIDYIQEMKKKDVA